MEGKEYKPPTVVLEAAKDALPDLKTQHSIRQSELEKAQQALTQAEDRLAATELAMAQIADFLNRFDTGKYVSWFEHLGINRDAGASSPKPQPKSVVGTVVEFSPGQTLAARALAQDIKKMLSETESNFRFGKSQIEDLCTILYSITQAYKEANDVR